MSRLKDRQRQIPNGFKFRLAEARYTAPPFQSFNVLVSAVEQVVRANPGLAAKNHWPTDRAGIENWVDSYNAKLCETYGWTDYIMGNDGGPAPPKWTPPQQPRRNPFQSLGRVAVGAEILDDWLGDGGTPVPAAQAEARAAICATCPRNDQGDWTRFFTVPAATAIRKKIEHRNALKLATSYDDKLKVCDACFCPLKLKVHTPVEYILKHLDEPTRADLDPRCWILKGM